MHCSRFTFSIHVVQEVSRVRWVGVGGPRPVLDFRTCNTAPRMNPAFSTPTGLYLMHVVGKEQTWGRSEEFDAAGLEIEFTSALPLSATTPVA